MEKEKEKEKEMQKGLNLQFVLEQDKVTKRTVRYTHFQNGESTGLQIYLKQVDLPLPYPQKIRITIQEEKG